MFHRSICLASDAEYLGFVPSPAFVAEGRIGDRGGAATFELDLGQETSAPAVTAQHAWISGQPEPFTLRYDAGLDQATFEMAGHTLQFAVDGNQFSHLFVRTRAVNLDSSIVVDQLLYNGQAVGDVSSAVGNGVDYLVLEDADPMDGFELSGVATLQWVGAAPTQSRLAFEVKLVQVNESVEQATRSLGALKAEY